MRHRRLCLAAAFALLGDAARVWGEEAMEQPWIVTGRVATVVHAHPLEAGRGDDVVYLDSDDGRQLAVYLRGDKPREQAWVEVSGRPVEFEASSRPDGRPARVRQLDASSWRPLRGREETEELVRRLGDAPAGERAALGATILAGGIDALPVLIAHLGDARVYEKDRDVQNYVGLPAKGPRPEPRYAVVTVGQVCGDLLHRLLTPPYPSPHAGVVKPRGELFIVRDWPKWWRENHRRSLAQLHKGLERLVDRYFLSGGDPQVVDAGEDWLAARIGEAVAIEGTAADGKLGAVLMTQHGTVWIDGLPAWPTGAYKGGREGRRLRGKGILVEREDLPVFEAPAPGEPQRSGVPVPKGSELRAGSRRYLLTDASWELIE